MKNKITILDGYTINPSSTELNQLGEFGEVAFYMQTPPSSIVQRIGESNIVLIDSTYIGKDTINSCPNIKLIAVMATGLNSVDINYAKKMGIRVMNVPAYGSSTVSQYAFSLLLYGASRLQEHKTYVDSGKWTKDSKESFDRVPYWDYPIFELSGKTMGVIGFGDIAKQSVKTALAFGMKVLVSTRYPDSEFMIENIRGKTLIFTDLNNIYKESDVIMIHCPLKDTNFGNDQGQAGFINKSAISLMKDGVIIINTARGKLINEKDLAESLNSGKVAFAGLDVLAEEPANPYNPLLTAKNCVITPHGAWTSNDARKRIFDKTIKNIQDFLNP